MAGGRRLRCRAPSDHACSKKPATLWRCGTGLLTQICRHRRSLRRNDGGKYANVLYGQYDVAHKCISKPYDKNIPGPCHQCTAHHYEHDASGNLDPAGMAPQEPHTAHHA